MPRIFDNIDKQLLPALKDTIQHSHRADFCVGYFNLRGWKQIDRSIEEWTGGEGNACRLLVGMHRSPQHDLREAIGVMAHDEQLDNQRVLKLKKQLAEEFREQLALGMPTDDDEAGLRRLAAQIRAKKVIVRLFLRHPLHAKLYLLFRTDPINPKVGFIGSSNLTFSGLSYQGELNVDVMDHDACEKLAKWFEDRWTDKWCIDISDELATIIETSWARELPVMPYHVYLKIAYHLAREARNGLSEFRIPREFGNRLFEFQTAAVKIAAHHLNKRGGVLIGDVVGLGKSLMATALAKIFQDDHGTETLIICPKNLVPMWEDYMQTYRLVGKIVPLSRVINELPELRRYRVVLLDESHNLRNREGRRYKAIQEYIAANDSLCILLSATPYNKTYLDLSAQLRLFVPEDKDIGIRPENMINQIGGETEFVRKHQCSVRSLAAFEKSDHADDWRELMRMYMVRRTRSFIIQNYADTDTATGKRFLTFEDGTLSYFPVRKPKTLTFEINDKDPADPYARAYSDQVVNAINALNLPRYGLGNYIAPPGHEPPTQAEEKILHGLGRAGTRLMGFCRTNLFKRLESGGPAFIQSLDRHILRNCIFLHALENGLPLPIGTQETELLDMTDEDFDAESTSLFSEGEYENDPSKKDEPKALDAAMDGYKDRAAKVYAIYSSSHKNRFKWLRASFFIKELQANLLADCQSLSDVIQHCGQWREDRDSKLAVFLDLISNQHPKQKILVFTQFADTAHYLEGILKRNGIKNSSAVTGASSDPTRLAWRFSPVSNDKKELAKTEGELRILIATDVLSEGQNLQDCAIIINYDLPWAIIRLIQRAGRVDRIGQQSDTILCYSFLPADGIERIIRLRGRVRQRLRENAEVVGSDEAFFEDDLSDQPIVNLYHEKSDVLDGDDDSEVDLASYAYQIWKNAIDSDPAIQKTVEDLPDVVYTTKPHTPRDSMPEGAMVYIRTAEDNDALAWVDTAGKIVTQSQLAILRASECSPDLKPALRLENHHALVKIGVEHLLKEEQSAGGALGRPSGARFRTYDRLKKYLNHIGNNRDLFITDHYVKSTGRALDDIYRYPLYQSAVDTLNRQLKSGIGDDALAQLVISLRDDDRLCMVRQDDEESREPRIICSLGLHAQGA